MTRNPKLSKSAAFLQANKERATSEELRQFRYIYWIDRKWKNNDFGLGDRMRNEACAKPVLYAGTVDKR